MVLKKGTKVKFIRLGNITDGHKVHCRMEEGNFILMAALLKKA
jgi:uncharacterized Zn ribbon protein